AAQILDLRSNDGSDAQPIPYEFGSDPGNYQSTPPNFPPQPQFTHWLFVTPFWRPVTAIQAGDTTGNPDVVAEPNFLPEVGNTPPDPFREDRPAAWSSRR